MQKTILLLRYGLFVKCFFGSFSRKERLAYDFRSTAEVDENFEQFCQHLFDRKRIYAWISFSLFCSVLCCRCFVLIFHICFRKSLTFTVCCQLELQRSDGVRVKVFQLGQNVESLINNQRDTRLHMFHDTHRLVPSNLLSHK